MYSSSTFNCHVKYTCKAPSIIRVYVHACIRESLPVCDQLQVVFGCTSEPHGGIAVQHGHSPNLLPSLLH